MTALVPWTPGRGVSYEEALEHEVVLLRSVLEAVLTRQFEFADTDTIVRRARVLLDDERVAAVRRALAGDGGA